MGDEVQAAPSDRRAFVTWYNLLSDQCWGLNAITVPGTLRDSLILLAIVLSSKLNCNQ